MWLPIIPASGDRGYARNVGTHDIGRTSLPGSPLGRAADLKKDRSMRPLSCMARTLFAQCNCSVYRRGVWMSSAMVYFRVVSQLAPGAWVGPSAATLVRLTPLCAISARSTRNS